MKKTDPIMEVDSKFTSKDGDGNSKISLQMF